MTTADSVSTTAPAAREPLTGARAQAHLVYIFLTGLFILGVWVAFFLAGAGVFGLNGKDLANKELEKQTVLDAHRVVGSLLGLLAILLVIVVLVARPGRGLVIGTVVLFLLALVGQETFAGVGEDHRWWGGAHVLNAGVILALSFWLHMTARKVPRA